MMIITNYDFRVKRSISTISYRFQYEEHFSVETGETLAESNGARIEELHSA